jgi:hypothetical protein
MDFNDILDTIFTYDETKPWAIVIPQVVFYCFRNYCVKRIIDSYELTNNISDTLGISWTNLYELCNQHCDGSFKMYLPDLFEPSTFEQFEDVELLEIFFKNFIQSLDILLEKGDETKEELFSNFLDKEIFTFFFKNIEDKKFYIFPTDIDNELNVETYLKLRETVITNTLIIEFEDINEKEISQLEPPGKIKTHSALKALLHKRRIKGKTYRNIHINTDKTRKLQSK